MSMIASKIAPVEQRLLAEFAAGARALLGERADRIVLFGSRARGDADRESDFDVLVLVRVSPQEIGRWRRALRDLATELELEDPRQALVAPLSILVLSTEEYRELGRRERRIARDIEAEGIPL